MQLNKRDLPDVIGEDDLNARWGATPWPITFASALAGDGVMESFSLLLGRIYVQLDQRHALASRHGLSFQDFLLCAGVSGAAI